MSALKKVFQRQPNTKKVQLIEKYMQSACHVNQLKLTDKKILCELPLDPIYILLFKSFYIDTRRENTSLKFVITKSIDAAIGTGALSFVKRMHFVIKFLAKKWLRLARINDEDVAFFSCQPSRPGVLFGDVIRAFKIWVEWRERYTQDTSAELIIDGIKCDDLVIDTFLRFKPSPQFNIRSKFNWLLILQVIKDCRLTQQYVDENRVDAIIVSYTTYIQHGVLVRIGIKNNINVFSFGDLGCFGLQHSRDYLHHTRKGHNYYKEFNALPENLRARLLKDSANFLETRLSGGCDPATKYMKKSAYGGTPKFKGNGEIAGSVVIFLHDFYDSPHIQEDLIFPDFYSWARETVEFLVNNNISYFVKPHPNQIPESDAAFRMLKKDIPSLKIIESSTNNKALVSGGMKLGISVYGTVCHELAYLGVKSVTAGAHPHIAFSFCYTPATKKAYFDSILDGLRDEPNRDNMRLEAKIFYGMHNYLNDLKLKDFLDTYNDFWFGANQASLQADELVLEKLSELRGNQFYKNFINELVDAK